MLYFLVMDQLKIIFIFFIFLLFYCERKSGHPAEVLDKKIFVQIYCDVVLTDDQLPPDQKKAIVDSIFAFHHVTPEAFENTVQRYNKNPNEWKKVFDSIVEELEKRLENLDNPPKPDSSVIKKD